MIMRENRSKYCDTAKILKISLVLKRNNRERRIYIACPVLEVTSQNSISFLTTIRDGNRSIYWGFYFGSRFFKIEDITKSFQILSIRPNSECCMSSNPFQSDGGVGFGRHELKSFGFCHQKRHGCSVKADVLGERITSDSFPHIKQSEIGRLLGNSLGLFEIRFWWIWEPK